MLHPKTQSDQPGSKPPSRPRERKIHSSNQSAAQLQSERTIPELFAASKHRTSEVTPPSPCKRRKRDHPGSSEETGVLLTEVLRPDQMYNLPRNYIDLTGSETASPPRKSPLQACSSTNNSTAQSVQGGTKKLVVKHIKRVSKADPDGYFNSKWIQLDNGLSAIFGDKKISLEEQYRGVENVCRQGKAPALFQKLSDRCAVHISAEVRASLIKDANKGANPVGLLRATLKAWSTWWDHLSIIRSIFYYMDRSYLLHSTSQPSIEELGKLLFRTSIFLDTALKPMILQGACTLISYDREGDDARFDSDLLRKAIDMFHTLSVYKQHFEPKMLGASQTFLQEWSEDRSESLSLARYVEECHVLINREISRCKSFALEISAERDLKTLLDRFLVAKQEPVLMRTEDVTELMAQGEMKSLKLLFMLLQRKGLGERLRPPFEVYINKEGSEIVFDEKRELEMVHRLLMFKKKLDTMWEESFDKHEGLGHSLREAFESFINKSKKSNMTWGTDNPKPGEMVAKYVDMILRGGVKAIPMSSGGTAGSAEVMNEDDMDEEKVDEDVQINQQLDQVLDMFRFVHGKAVFEAFYKRDLARRLLMGRSASADAEKNMLNRLKSECGSGFTHNLEQMFKDMELGREDMSSYKQMLQSSQKKAPVDLNVSVLSASAWPTYPDLTVEVPRDIQIATADFEQHYKLKHGGRRLAWKHALAHCQLKASFPKGKKEIVVSSFQAVVMLYFNDKAANETVGFAELKEATSLGDEELKRTLQSLACAKYRVLTKAPKSKEVDPTDTFTLNLGFSDPKYRIKINQVQLKETKAENKETHERVAADRHYETQAAIVRIMKSRKTIRHAELVAEVIKATKSRGVLDPADIKRNIEKLIEKDYMEREEGKNAYTYLA